MRIVEEQSVTNLDQAHSHHPQSQRNSRTRSKIRQFSLNQDMKVKKRNEKDTHQEKPINQSEEIDSPAFAYINSKKINKNGSPINKQEGQSYKKVYEELNSQNMKLKQQINFMSEDLVRKLKKIETLKVKTAQAQSDKIELMRDLATYECNFGENSGIRSTLMQLHKKVESVKNKIQLKNQQSSQSEGWLGQTTSIFLNHLQELSILKRDRGSVSEINGVDFFTPQRGQVSSSQGFNQIYQNKQKVSQLQNDGYSYEEQQFLSLSISGFNCTVQANIMNGVVQIFASNPIINKSFKLELKPLNNKQKTQLSREIKRLYFSIDFDSTSKKASLLLSARDDYEGNNNQAIIQLKGSKVKWCNAIIFTQQNQPQYTSSNDEDQDQCRVLIKVGLDQEYELEIKRNGRENSEIFKDIEANYVLRQTNKGSYEVSNISDQIGNLIPTVKWLQKIKNAKTISQTTMDYLEIGEVQDKLQLKQQHLNKIKIEDQDDRDGELVLNDDESDLEQINDKKKKEIVIDEEITSSLKDEDDNSLSEQSKEYQDNKNKTIEKDSNMNFQELEDLDRHKKKYLSQRFDLDELLQDLQIKHVKSLSQKNLIDQYQILSKTVTQDQHNNQSKQTKQKQQSPQPLTLEETQLKIYEFFYHYTWFQNNWAYHQVHLKKLAEQERVRQLEISVQRQIQYQMEDNHDNQQIQNIRENLVAFRHLFRGPVQLTLKLTPSLIHSDEFMLNDQIKVTLHFFPGEEEDDLQIFINKLNVNESINSRRSSRAGLVKYYESLMINDDFLDHLNLYAFKTLQLVKEKIKEFSQFEIVREIISYQIQALINENKQIYKTFDQQPPLKFSQVNSIRKMESEIQNTIKTFGDKTSSDYGETSMNDSYSKYLR